jgi:hypothetical protein
VSSIDLSVDGARQTLQLGSGCAVVIANGAIEATRLALESLGVGISGGIFWNKMYLGCFKVCPTAGRHREITGSEKAS